MTLVETLGNVARFAGLLVTILGLWFSAGGVRVVVSGRIDERKRSAMSMKKALLLLAVGVVLVVVGTLMVNWSHRTSGDADVVSASVALASY